MNELTTTTTNKLAATLHLTERQTIKAACTQYTEHSTRKTIPVYIETRAGQFKPALVLGLDPATSKVIIQYTINGSINLRTIAGTYIHDRLKTIDGFGTVGAGASWKSKALANTTILALAEPVTLD